MFTGRERQQHLDRGQSQLMDQHGRVWLATTELGIDAHRRPLIAPVGGFTPNFTVPYDFIPPMKYLIYDNRRPQQITIAYRQWIADQQAAHRAVKDHLAQLAWLIYRDHAPEAIKNPTPDMLEIAYGRGKGPEPWEPIVAAMQGNGWILGLRPYDPALAGDVKLLPFLERWVEVRYRDARLLDDVDLPDDMNFTEGQGGELVTLGDLTGGVESEELSDADLEKLTAPSGKGK
jgi:hypothetical protein